MPSDPRHQDVRSPLLEICTPPDLARLLGSAMAAAGLTVRQLAARTAISRSQIYLLTDPTRGSLPRNREQLDTFLRACRLRETDIRFVLYRWEQLDRLRRLRSLQLPVQLPRLNTLQPRENHMHTDAHPLAGQTVTVHGTTAVLEDWWDRITDGHSWMLQNTPITIDYGQRRLAAGLPVDDHVVYVKARGHGQLAHASEISPGNDPGRDS